MDFFALPDLFLRQLMKSMEIKDRLRMRLTCRAFEKLVAETHAGCFYDGRIIQGTDENKFSFHIGLAHFNDMPATEEGFEQCLNLRNRLFDRIELTSFSINWPDNACLDFICKFTEKFKIESLSFFVSSEKLLAIARQMMANFPSSKYTMTLEFMPEEDVLLSFPPMESLSIKDYAAVRGDAPWLITSELFFALLNAHECLDLDSTILQEDDCERAMAIIASQSDARFVQVQLETATVKNWLSGRGFTHEMKEGDRSRGLEVLNAPGQFQRQNDMVLRYSASQEQCTLKIDKDVWNYGISNTRMYLTNR